MTCINVDSEGFFLVKCARCLCLPCCSTKEAFKKKIGFLGADSQAERMTDAFVTHGVVMKPEEIKYHAPKADAAIEKLGLKSTTSAAEVGTLALCMCCMCVQKQH